MAEYDSRTIARFWSKVNRKGPNDCWNWTAAKGRGGYGVLGVNGATLKAHRISWALAFGGGFEGLCVIHNCDNPPCVNPGHLRLGTHADNMLDIRLRGRARCGESHPCARLNADQVREIRKLYAAGVRSVEIARMFPINQRRVRDVATGKKWFHVALQEQS